MVEAQTVNSPPTPDVVVIGAGLSGVAAAVSLRAAGLHVAVSSGAPGHSAHFGGAWQLAFHPAAYRAQTQDPQADLAAHLRRVAEHVPSHPFARLGAEASLGFLRHAWACLDKAMPHDQAWPRGLLTQPIGYVPHTSGVLLPGVGDAHIARLRPQALAEGAVAPPVAVLDAAAFGAPLPPRALAGWAYDAERLGAALPPLLSIRLPAPKGAPPWATAHALGLARYLDSEAGRDAFVEQVRALVPAQATEVWLPGVLGLLDNAGVRGWLQEALARPVREVPSTTAAPAGVRRQRALGAALVNAGVAALPRARTLEVRGERVDVRLVDGTELSARRVVVATGRFVGGGFAWPSQKRCQESLLHLPLSSLDVPLTQCAPLDVTAALPRAAQALEAAGVPTNEWLQPLRPDGSPITPVHLVGGLLGGYHDRTSPCADGVALASAGAAAHAVAHALHGVAASVGGP